MTSHAMPLPAGAHLPFRERVLDRHNSTPFDLHMSWHQTGPKNSSLAAPQMHNVLSGNEGAWPARVGGPPAPSKGHLLVPLFFPSLLWIEVEADSNLTTKLIGIALLPSGQRSRYSVAPSAPLPPSHKGAAAGGRVRAARRSHRSRCCRLPARGVPGGRRLRVLAERARAGGLSILVAGSDQLAEAIAVSCKWIDASRNSNSLCRVDSMCRGLVASVMLAKFARVQHPHLVVMCS